MVDLPVKEASLQIQVHLGQEPPDRAMQVVLRLKQLQIMEPEAVAELEPLEPLARKGRLEQPAPLEKLALLEQPVQLVKLDLSGLQAR